MLFNEKKESTDKYIYDANDHNGSSLKIEIIFINKKFNHCKFNFSGIYSREEWNLLGEINDKIKSIEDSYYKKNKTSY